MNKKFCQFKIIYIVIFNHFCSNIGQNQPKLDFLKCFLLLYLASVKEVLGLTCGTLSNFQSQEIPINQCNA